MAFSTALQRTASRVSPDAIASAAARAAVSAARGPTRSIKWPAMRYIIVTGWYAWLSNNILAQTCENSIPFSVVIQLRACILALMGRSHPSGDNVSARGAITQDDFVEYAGDMLAELMIMASRVGLPTTSTQMILVGNVMRSEARMVRSVDTMKALPDQLARTSTPLATKERLAR